MNAVKAGAGAVNAGMHGTSGGQRHSLWLMLQALWAATSTQTGLFLLLIAQVSLQYGCWHMQARQLSTFFLLACPFAMLSSIPGVHTRSLVSVLSLFMYLDCPYALLTP